MGVRRDIAFLPFVSKLCNVHILRSILLSIVRDFVGMHANTRRVASSFTVEKLHLKRLQETLTKLLIEQ